MELCRHIAVINSEEPDWQERVTMEKQSKRNCVVILSHHSLYQTLCLILLGGDCSPERLDRWDIYALQGVIKEEDFRLLLYEGLQLGKPVCFVEQIKLETTRPPWVKNHLVYCELRGIVSEADSIDDAQGKLREYAAKNPSDKSLPLTGIYTWLHDRWFKAKALGWWLPMLSYGLEV